MTDARSNVRVQERTRGAKWTKARRLLLMQEPLCRACHAAGRSTVAEEIDHIVPLFKGGTDDFANLQPLCKSCHADKSRQDGSAEKPEIGLDGWPKCGGGK